MSAQNTRYVAPGQSSAGLGSYATKNLNAYMKPPPRTNTGSRGPLVVLGTKPDKSRGLKSVGVAAAPTPIPLNTPSLKRENNGKDINTVLVPVGGSSVWGSHSINSESKNIEEGSSNSISTNNSAVQQINKPAPWTSKRSEMDSSNEISNSSSTNNAESDGGGTATATATATASKQASKMKSWVDDSDEDDDDEVDQPPQRTGGNVPNDSKNQTFSGYKPNYQQNEFSDTKNSNNEMNYYSNDSNRFNSGPSGYSRNNNNNNNNNNNHRQQQQQPQPSFSSAPPPYQYSSAYNNQEPYQDYRNQANLYGSANRRNFDPKQNRYEDDKPASLSGDWRQKSSFDSRTNANINKLSEDPLNAEKAALEASRIERELLENRKKIQQNQQQQQQQPPHQQQRQRHQFNHMPPNRTPYGGYGYMDPGNDQNRGGGGGGGGGGGPEAYRMRPLGNQINSKYSSHPTQYSNQYPKPPPPFMSVSNHEGSYPQTRFEQGQDANPMGNTDTSNWARKPIQSDAPTQLYRQKDQNEEDIIKNQSHIEQNPPKYDDQTDLKRNENTKQKLLFDPKTGKLAVSDKSKSNNSEISKISTQSTEEESLNWKRASPLVNEESHKPTNHPSSVLTRPKSEFDNSLKSKNNFFKEKENSENDIIKLKLARSEEKNNRGSRTKGLLYCYNVETNEIEQVLTAAEKLLKESSLESKKLKKVLDSNSGKDSGKIDPKSFGDKTNNLQTNNSVDNSKKHPPKMFVSVTPPNLTAWSSSHSTLATLGVISSSEITQNQGDSIGVKAAESAPSTFNSNLAFSRQKDAKSSKDTEGSLDIQAFAEEHNSFMNKTTFKDFVPKIGFYPDQINKKSNEVLDNNIDNNNLSLSQKNMKNKNFKKSSGNKSHKLKSNLESIPSSDLTNLTSNEINDEDENSKLIKRKSKNKPLNNSDKSKRKNTNNSNKTSESQLDEGKDRSEKDDNLNPPLSDDIRKNKVSVNRKNHHSNKLGNSNSKDSIVNEASDASSFPSNDKDENLLTETQNTKNDRGSQKNKNSRGRLNKWGNKGSANKNTDLSTSSPVITSPPPNDS